VVDGSPGTLDGLASYPCTAWKFCATSGRNDAATVARNGLPGQQQADPLPAPSAYGPDRLLTVEDVAGFLQVSAVWVRDHATRKQPRLPVVRVGKLLRFRPHEIEKWIREQSQREC
jgi:hypothetical protein